MDVSSQAGSGQSSGNTGSGMDLSDAISAAVAATTSGNEVQKQDDDVEALLEPGVQQTAEDQRSTEDAKAGDVVAEGQKPEDKPQTFDPPQHWPEADKKAFSALPPDAQSIIKRLAKDLEGGFTRRSQELSDKAKYADAVRTLIDDATRQQIAATGMNELQYLQYLHQIQQYAARDPKGYAKWAIQQLGVSPEDLGFRTTQPDTQENPEQSLEALLSDPKVKLLEERLAQFEAKLTEREKAELWARQSAQAQQERALVNQIQTFRAQQDDNGQLKFPHFDKLQRQMGEIMNSYPEIAQMPEGQEKLAAAYEAAMWAHPELRSSQLEIERKMAVAKAEKAREADRAKRVTAVKPATSVATQSAKPKSLDDIIRDAMAQHG